MEAPAPRDLQPRRQGFLPQGLELPAVLQQERLRELPLLRQEGLLGGEAREGHQFLEAQVRRPAEGVARFPLLDESADLGVGPAERNQAMRVPLDRTGNAEAPVAGGEENPPAVLRGEGLPDVQIGLQALDLRPGLARDEDQGNAPRPDDPQRGGGPRMGIPVVVQETAVEVREDQEQSVHGTLRIPARAPGPASAEKKAAI